MQNHGLTKLEDYAKYLHEAPAELSALVEAVVVKETWFFRDKEPFTALVRLVQSEWLPTHPVGPLRLLSIPCSTGEEPYSMSMALSDGGLPGDRFQIDAVDISSHALESAQRAVYRKNSFRGQARDYRERHFQPWDDGYLLNQGVRDQVRFQKGNILDGDCLDGGGVYDFIFCRNLLIYFDRPTQEKVLQKLGRLLKKTGVLFVGPVELPLVASQGFASARIPMAAACRKLDSIPKPQTERSHRHKKPSSKNLASRSTSTPTKPISRPPSPPVSATKSSPTFSRKQAPQADLENAARLADEGRLAEATQLCKNYIRVHGASAQAYYLLGLVGDAEGNDAQAVDFYRKALYLEPNHYETLVQMATLSGKKGDTNGARLLHKRAQRVLGKP
jgi:chemotaxis protein methyltransferase WspC